MASSDEELSELTLAPIAGQVVDDQLSPGARAGAYSIVQLLGRGGCGKVYLATREGDERRAALKVLNAELATDPLSVERFLREVRTVDRLKHPHIVEIYETGRLPDERPWFAMELLEGQNLRRALQVEGRLSPVETYEILEQVCAALEAAHALGVVHRDLKAENVIIDLHRCVKLVDFGVAKLLEPDENSPGLTTTRQVIGTLSAMAPEQIRSERVDQRTDIYALGALAFNLLTGVHLFRGSPETIARMHLETPPRPPSTLVPLSPLIDTAILRCLEKDPAARFQSVGAFLAALRQAVFGEDVPTRGRVGLGVLVRASASDPGDEDLLAEAVVALDEAEAALRAGGYQIPVQTSSEVLGVRELPSSPADERVARRQAIEDGQRIYDAARAVAAPGVRLSVVVHTNEIQVRVDSGVVVGGPLLEMSAWSLGHEGVQITARTSALT
jgi:serine/threonine-protein kinase